MEVFKQLPELVEQLEKDWDAFKKSYTAHGGQDETHERKED